MLNSINTSMNLNLPIVTRAEVKGTLVAIGTEVESPTVLVTTTVVDSVSVTATVVGFEVVTATVVGSGIVTTTVVDSAGVVATVVGSAVVVGAVVAGGHRGDPTGVELTPLSVENNINTSQQISH